MGIHVTICMTSMLHKNLCERGITFLLFQGHTLSTDSPSWYLVSCALPARTDSQWTPWNKVFTDVTIIIQLIKKSLVVGEPEDLQLLSWSRSTPCTSTQNCNLFVPPASTLPPVPSSRPYWQFKQNLVRIWICFTLYAYYRPTAKVKLSGVVPAEPLLVTEFTLVN